MGDIHGAHKALRQCPDEVDECVAELLTIRNLTDKPMHAANIINLDTGAGASGRLTIMDVKSKKFWQSDPVHRLYS
jgi:hypothetical protein